MNTNQSHIRRVSSPQWLATCVTLGCAALLMAGQTQAQTVYRVVGPNGKVTFSDKPPAPSENASATGVGGKALGNSSSALPFELRQVVSKYPVTLYISNNCAPCDSGRALLIRRGIPFAEKTVTTGEDAEALKRISGETSLPFLTIGGQQIKGFSDSEWAQFLDAAGYPKSSVLPAGFQNAAVTPLVVIQKPGPAVKAEEKKLPQEPAAPSTPAENRSNPAGITF